MMSERQLREAQQLIKQKRYAEAREILERIDHRIAYDWLVRIDEVAPAPLKPLPMPNQDHGCMRFIWLGLLGCIAVLVVLVATTAPLTQESNVTDNGSDFSDATNATATRQSVDNNAASITPSGTGTETPIPTASPTFESVENFYVTLSANARSCASTDCETVIILNRGTRVEVVGSEHGQAIRGNTTWRLVLAEGQVTYIHASLLSQTLP